MLLLKKTKYVGTKYERDDTSPLLVVFGNCSPWKEIHRTRKHLSTASSSPLFEGRLYILPLYFVERKTQSSLVPILRNMLGSQSANLRHVWLNFMFVLA